MNVRPARPDEIPFLTVKAAEIGWKRDDLDKCVVMVLEDGGIPCGFIDGSLCYKINNLCMFAEYRRHAPPAAIRRGVFLLARSMVNFMRQCGAARYIVGYIETRRFQRLCKSFGMIPLPRKGRWFALDL